MIIISSTIHNILDGIATGVSFSSRKVPLIISTNLAILFHEIPKELGDAGILIYSNFNIWSVLFWNSLINATCIIGTIIGLSVGSINKRSESYCLGFVAGNFLYISLAEMIPVINRKKNLLNNMLQILFILVGLLIMFAIIFIE
jgi:zinc transporter ZupT